MIIQLMKRTLPSTPNALIGTLNRPLHALISLVLLQTIPWYHDITELAIGWQLGQCLLHGQIS